MTETSSLFTTYSVPNPYPVTAPPTSVSPIPNANGNLSPPNAPEEEEYTIKCICGYNDDDGNTVFCEKCDTWQHIECYYHGKKVPDIHFCTECAPKGTFSDTSAEKARERQRRAREPLEGGGDRRVKRPTTTKGQKKKHRDTITNTDQPNGWTNYERQESVPNGKDQPPPAKKPKTNHRASGSIASLNGEPRKRAHSNLQSYPSPSKSPQELYRYPIIPRYTSDFLDLYDRDSSSWATKNWPTISGSLALSAWKTDPTLVTTQPDSAQSDKSIFTRLDHDIDSVHVPKVAVEKTQGRDGDLDGRLPTWKLTRLQDGVRKNAIVGEVRGQIGTLDEWCQQLTSPNRWKTLSHPDPFVFFHPFMDIYIDSRKHGTQFRYIRRSCIPNVTMRSFITPDDEVHHCFVAKDDLPAGSELTASWYLPPQFLVGDDSQDGKEQLFQERCDYISRVLANFGDCACGLPKCRLDPFDRRSSMKPPDLPKAPTGRKRKPKTKHAISPLSTGQATNSRAGSETIKGQDEDDDHRSTSSSSQNGAHSRDLTPQGGALLDEPPVLGAGLTQREIRKIQALEKASKEQTQKGDKKPKKRPSAASNLNTSAPGVFKQSNTDVKRYSGSPPPHRLGALKDVVNRPTPLKTVQKQPRPIYVSVAVQTDSEQPDEQEPVLKRRRFCTPTQRLLKQLLHQRMQCRTASTTTSSDDTQGNEQQEDIEMKDATTSVSTSPSTAKSPSTSPLLESSRHAGVPLPSQAAHTHRVHGRFKTPAHRLNLSTLPPVPIFASTATGSASDVTTPSIAQSPGPFGPPSLSLSVSAGPTITPSPAKKKLSLGDYMSRKKESATPSTEKVGLNLSGPSETDQERRASESRSEPDYEHKSFDVSQSDGLVSEAANVRAVDDEHAIEDVPVPDGIHLASPKLMEVSQQTPIARNASSEVQNVLSSLQQMHQRHEIGNA